MEVRFTLARIAILIALVSSAGMAVAAGGFEYLSITDGLSQSTIHCIVQDRNGYMWFGTEDGLNRYDGYRFMVYRHQPGDPAALTDNYINSFCIDSSGTLWIGTKNGVCSWNAARESFGRLPHVDPHIDSLIAGECTALAVGTDGTLWIGTPNGLIRYNLSNSSASLFIHDSRRATTLGGNDIRSIYMDNEGTIWIGTMERGRGRGLNKIDSRTGSIRTYSIPRNQVAWTLQEDRSGAILIGSYDGGILVFDKKSETFSRYRIFGSANPADNHVWSLCHGTRGDLWIGTGGGGLVRSMAGTEGFRRYTLDDNYILSLYEDRSEVLWIGTGKGIQKYDIKKERFGEAPRIPLHVPSKREVWSFWPENDGSVWIGTGDGLYRRDEGGVIRAIPGLGGFDVYSVCRDSKGVVWMATPRGVVSYDVRTKARRWLRAGPPGTNTISDLIVNVLALDREQNLWFGTGAVGINRLDLKTGIIDRYFCDSGGTVKNRIASNSINAILEDRNGMMWFGTNNGLFRLERQSGAFFGYRQEPEKRNTISNSRVISLCEDRSGTLWVGTSVGLNRFDRATGEFTTFGINEGLPNDLIYAIAEDDRGYLWFSTNRGLSRFDPSKKSFRNYDERDGLQGREFNRGASAKSKKGEIFFGGINGFNSFHPEKVNDNPVLPPVVITDFKVFDRSIGALPSRGGNMEVELKYSQNFFSIEFAALDYSCPAKNRYEYVLEGFDKDWIACGTRRYAAYTNLDGGDYVFRVRGSNNDGVWNRTGTVAVIRIIPPYWKTGWFRVLAVLVVGCIVAVLVQIRFRRLKRLAEEQQRMSRQLIESQENERKRIGAGLHDSLGQNLLIIKNLAVMGIESGMGRRKVKDHFDNISSIASQALTEVRNISYDLRPYQLDRLGLTGALRSIMTRISASSQIVFTDDLDNVDGLFPKDLEINIFRIVQEAVNNIVKHSKAKNARVEVKRTEVSVVIGAIDDGVGFDTGHRGFGLTSLSERARILKGTLSVESTPGSGTVLSVVIPLRKES